MFDKALLHTFDGLRAIAAICFAPRARSATRGQALRICLKRPSGSANYRPASSLDSSPGYSIWSIFEIMDDCMRRKQSTADADADPGVPETWSSKTPSTHPCARAKDYTSPGPYSQQDTSLDPRTST